MMADSVQTSGNNLKTADHKLLNPKYIIPYLRYNLVKLLIQRQGSHIILLFSAFFRSKS